MNSSTQLKLLLSSIDRKSYPAYKSAQGSYQFPDYILSIDHVQGDPFASPSSVSILITHEKAGYPARFFDTAWRKTALEDYLVRKFHKEIAQFNFKAKGSGKSGLISISSPGPEVLSRTACECGKKDIAVRFEIGFPANGRTINSGELIKIFFDFLPQCIQQVFFFKNRKASEVKAVADLSDDQEFIRGELPKLGLVSFVSNDAILPRESGVSSRPMLGMESVPFQTPKSLLITLDLPHHGAVTGMGIPKGVTLIVGGGYHGKSTLLKALEAGVYNHIAGDGREYVITDSTAVKLRAEDGRSINNVDISLFINALPNKKDTTRFSTQDASGSTSQAAAVIEGIEAGSKVFLIDEDTSATNFMVRDDLMQRIISRDKEPITPFIERVRALYEKADISTVMVAGSSGAYFYVADTIIQMDHYKPLDITKETKDFCAGYGAKPAVYAPDFCLPKKDRVLLCSKPFRNEKATPPRPSHNRDSRSRDNQTSRDNRLKTKTFGKDSLMVGTVQIDLRFVEQLADSEQTAALAKMLCWCMENQLLERFSVRELVEQLLKKAAADGLSSMNGHSYSAMGLSMPRSQEIFACLNRYR